MAWLTLGAFLLFAAGSASFQAPHRVDAVSIAALTCLAATLLRSFHVYPAQGAILAFVGGLAGALMLRTILPPPQGSLRLLALAIGAASCLFALFGPAEGLF